MIFRNPQPARIARHSNRPAFTLIELLVVVAIIALLIAILVPSLAGAKNQARKATCLANLRGLAQLALLYQNDYDGAFPTRKNRGTAPNVFDAFEASRTLLRGDGRSLKFFSDPADDFPGREYPVGSVTSFTTLVANGGSSGSLGADYQTLGLLGNTVGTNTYGFTDPNQRVRVSYGINTQLTLAAGSGTYTGTDELGNAATYQQDAASSNKLSAYQFQNATVLYADSTWVNARGSGQNDAFGGSKAAASDSLAIRYRIALAGFPDRLAWNGSSGANPPKAGAATTGTDPNTGSYTLSSSGPTSVNTSYNANDLASQATIDALATGGKYQRHKTGNNIAFLDAHAETVPFKDVMDYSYNSGAPSAKIIWSPQETAK